MAITSRNNSICILMMGGIGSRTKLTIPKQFVEIKGRPIFSFILEEMEKSDAIDSIIIVSTENYIDFTRMWCEKLGCKKVYSIVPGGDCRSKSVLNGLEKASEVATDESIIMLHDTTHPYVDNQGMQDLIEAVNEYGGATLGQRQYDTCYEIDENDMLVKVVPRERIVSGASPEAFKFKYIYPIYKNATKEELDAMTSAGAMALKHNIPMKICTLNSLNLKLTFKEDLDLLMAAAGTYFFKEELENCD